MLWPYFLPLFIVFTLKLEQTICSFFSKAWFLKPSDTGLDLSQDICDPH